jgi:hypothetical protein
MVYLERLGKVVGSADICKRIMRWEWDLNTTFTGASCLEIAAASLQGQCDQYMKKYGSLQQRALFAKKPRVSFGYEGSAYTHHDHIHRGQDKSEIGPQLALESVSRGVWH